MNNKLLAFLLMSFVIGHSCGSNLKPLSLVICGPSGVGKGTIINKVLQKYDAISLSVSHTTRQPRPGEINGVHYHFVTEDAMARAIANNMFLEYAYVHGNTYGTSKWAVDTIQRQNRICLLDVDVEGVKQIRQLPEFLAKFVFIAPPSIDTLEQRLRSRATESEDQLSIRLGNAKSEIEYGLVEGNFDCIIVNDDLETAFESLCTKINDWFPSLLSSKHK